MSDKSSPKSPQTREDRLKAALKANLGRRKVQARAKAAQNTGATAPQDTGATAPQDTGATAPQDTGATAPQQSGEKSEKEKE